MCPYPLWVTLLYNSMLILGVYAIGVFLPDVIMAVKGLIGIVVLLAGLMLIIFGILIFKE